MKKLHQLRSQDTIRAEARAWVLTFNGDTPPSSADIEALKKWVKQSPIHRAELERAENLWCDASLLSKLMVPLTALDKQTRPSPGMLAGFNPVAGVAVILICTAVMVSYWLLWPGPVGNGTYYTAIGEQKLLTLKDDSKIQLDTDSRVKVVYTEQQRNIQLLRGKAHFEVSKNPKRPFDVYAGSGRVRAVGTAFSVYLNDQDVSVIVDEGRVDLARLTPTRIADTVPSKESTDKPTTAGEVFLSLDKGQQALFNQEEEVLSELADFELSKQLAWRRGVLIFSADPLSHVVSEVSRYTDVTIEISDPELSELLVGGRFRAGELEPLFDVLEVGFGVRVSYVNSNRIKLHVSRR